MAVLELILSFEFWETLEELSMEFVVADLDSLRTLASDRSLKRCIRRIRIVCAADPEAASLENQLNRCYFACGCKSGALAVYLVLLSSLLWWIFDYPVAFRWDVSILAIVLASLVGKLVGLIVSAIWLRRIFKQIEHRFSLMRGIHAEA